MSGKKRKLDFAEEKIDKRIKSPLFREACPESYKLIHPTKNEGIYIEGLTCGSKKKLWFACPVCEHHVWQATIFNMTRERKKVDPTKTIGCPFCHGKQTCECQSAGKLYPHLEKQFDKEKNGDLDIMKLPP